MSIRRLHVESAYVLKWHDAGAYCYYKDHVAIVALMQKQLDMTQRMLETEQQKNAKLIDALTR